MARMFTLSLTLLFAVACDRAAEETSVPGAEDEAEEMIEVTETYSGGHAYELVCARCHEEGVDGAPRTGVAEDWVDRSPLWEAVLFEHANKGYNDMPAKGGQEWLGDDMVEKAAEYMLQQVYREPPPD